MHTPAHVLGKVVGAAGPLNKKSVNFSGQKTNGPASPSNTGAGACTGTLCNIALPGPTSLSFCYT